MDPAAHAARLAKLISSANWKLVTALIREYPDPALYSRPLPCGRTPLQLASLLGAVDVVRALLALGLSPVDPAAHIFAARNGHAVVLRALLPLSKQCPGPPACHSALAVPRPGPALHAAAWHAHTAAAEVILAALCPSAKRSALSWTAQNGGTSLHAAALSGDARLVQVLLTAGASISARDADGFRPIGWARRFFVAGGRGQDVVDLLIDAEAKARAEAACKSANTARVAEPVRSPTMKRESFRATNVLVNEPLEADEQATQGPPEPNMEGGQAIVAVKVGGRQEAVTSGKNTNDDRAITERAPCVPRAVRPAAGKPNAAPPCHAV